MHVNLCPQLIHFLFTTRQAGSVCLTLHRSPKPEKFSKDEISIKYRDYDLKILDLIEAVSIREHYKIFVCLLVNAM